MLASAVQDVTGGFEVTGSWYPDSLGVRGGGAHSVKFRGSGREGRSLLGSKSQGSKGGVRGRCVRAIGGRARQGGGRGGGVCIKVGGGSRGVGRLGREPSAGRFSNWLHYYRWYIKLY